MNEHSNFVAELLRAATGAPEFISSAPLHPMAAWAVGCTFRNAIFRATLNSVTVSIQDSCTRHQLSYP
jgi:hypothetical protein